MVPAEVMDREKNSGKLATAITPMACEFKEATVTHDIGHLVNSKSWQSLLPFLSFCQVHNFALSVSDATSPCSIFIC